MALTQINVTADDIKRGNRGCSMGCAVARAIARTTGKYGNVTVSDASIYVFGFREIPTPEHVADWIVRFDSGRPVEPISFEIELIETADAAAC